MSIVRALTQAAPQRLATADTVPIAAPDEDRRESPRHDCQVDAYCQPLASQGSRWPAKAVDISASGVSLVLSRRFEPGTLLAIGLQGALDESMPLARVQRVAPDGLYWRIGCLWSDPLSPEDLRGLIGFTAE